MEQNQHSTTNAHRVFAGLTPGVASQPLPRSSRIDSYALSRSLLNTVPIVVAGSVAVTGISAAHGLEQRDHERHAHSERGTSSASVDSAAERARAKQQLREAFDQAIAGAVAPDSVTTGSLAAAAAPSTYRVVSGDTVSGIAAKFGLSTASVLAMNGLGWKSLIFPGQVLKLANGTTAAPKQAPAPTAAVSSGSRYTIRTGDTISGIAARHGLSTQTLLSANGLSWSSIIYPGQTIAIPGLSAASVAAPTVSAPTPAEPTTPVVSGPSTLAGGTYTIVRGDTLTAIAQKTGVTLRALLDANGLTSSSMIYAGRTLTIPAAAVVQTGETVTPLTAEMRANARIIVDVGRSLGVPEYGIVIALAAAMQESSLRNIDYGDRDSLGLFQQRPSAGWGTPAQILNATHSAKLFYGGPQNPNRGVTRGLLDIPGWQDMTLTKAAQAVQVSAHPEAYAKWETSARAWYSELR
ncbi:muramidase family protein [Ruicaihuangia caeni]|uniref:muramidase family protein n=1 Tax=Ruicaihuangia caeni TaxID=3042517 RepID=UPI0033905926